jgi:hypothetical protein
MPYRRVSRSVSQPTQYRPPALVLTLLRSMRTILEANSKPGCTFDILSNPGMCCRVSLIVPSNPA